MADEPTLADAVVKTDEQRRQEAKGPAAPVKAVQRAMKKPWIAHLIRMNDRFGERLGSQFTGAITYFTFLSLVPLSEGVLLGSINIVAIMIAGRYLFAEKLSRMRVAGILLISIGVTIVGWHGG